VSEAEEILTYAHDHSIRMLDTAVSYGNAEEMLGRVISAKGVGSDWKIVTKTPHFNVARISSKQKNDLVEHFEASLQKLNQKSVYGLLIHACDDLFVPGGEALFDELQQLKQQGLVEKVGVSLYDTNQIDRVLESHLIDLVQLPVNILDQRLVKNGRLSRLKERGVEIHARSVFLQGLLLMDLESVPSWFDPIRETLKGVHAEAHQRELTPLQLALGFLEGLDEIDQIVVGVNTKEQLREVIDAAERVQVNPSEFSELAIDDSCFVNPLNWRV